MKSRTVLIATVALCLGACASNSTKEPVKPRPDKEVTKQERAKQRLNRRTKRYTVLQLYQLARATLESGDYASALEYYGQIESNFPFTPFATQAQLETIYAHYRSYAPDLALASADRFVRSHPRHLDIAYVHYLKGLINFERTNADILDLFDVDSAKRDPVNLKRAFEEFSRLIQRYPDSPYAADARARMIFLKNRIALHEQSIADYYFKRRAYVAASRRALDIIAKFRGTPTIPDALTLLAKCYDELKLPEQASSVRAALKASYPDYRPGAAKQGLPDRDDALAQPPELDELTASGYQSP